MMNAAGVPAVATILVAPHCKEVRMTFRRLVSLIVLALALCNASGAAAQEFEVWLIDQSNSAGVAYGGAIHIYQGDDLMGEDAAVASPTTIDLAGATAQLCMASTGANPVRPH